MTPEITSISFQLARKNVDAAIFEAIAAQNNSDQVRVFSGVEVDSIDGDLMVTFLLAAPVSFTQFSFLLEGLIIDLRQKRVELTKANCLTYIQLSRSVGKSLNGHIK